MRIANIINPDGSSSSTFLKARKIDSRTILDSFILESLFIWSNLNNSNLEQAVLNMNKLDNRFENLKKIQNVFLNCYFSSNKTNILFEQLISNIKTDFSRYNYFYAKYLVSVGENDKAKKIINTCKNSNPIHA